MRISLTQEYIESLAALTGNDFQAEVCARLRSVILGFQPVPAKPQGDAGLDGFSHDGERGYCCYGPERSEFKTNKTREKGVVEKFKSDLRRLFELEFNNGKLVCSENPEMATILPKGKKLQHIELIVNWFESHRVLSPILTAVAEYKALSKCRYVDPGASVIVTGPKELANSYAVDESTIVRARQRDFMERVQKTALAVTIDNPVDFDFKMKVLLEIRPDQHEAIKGLTEQFRADWCMALAFERELDETLPQLHRTLEDDRGRILARVSQLMLASKSPWTELSHASDIAEEILNQDFGKLYGSGIKDVSSGEIARLIGECPISWENPSVAHA